MLFIGLTLIIITAAYINVVTPNSPVSLLGFFALLGSASLLLGMYVFGHMRHALLVSAGLIVYLTIRLIGLRHPAYTLLLIASVIALEYLWKENS